MLLQCVAVYVVRYAVQPPPGSQKDVYCMGSRQARGKVGKVGGQGAADSCWEGRVWWDRREERVVEGCSAGVWLQAMEPVVVWYVGVEGQGVAAWGVGLGLWAVW